MLKKELEEEILKLHERINVSDEEVLGLRKAFEEANMDIVFCSECGKAINRVNAMREVFMGISPAFKLASSIEDEILKNDQHAGSFVNETFFCDECIEKRDIGFFKRLFNKIRNI